MEENSKVKIFINNQEVVLMNPELEIHKQVNEHTRLILKGIVMAESYSILEQMEDMAQLQVQLGEEKQDWFIGLVTYTDSKIQIQEERQYQELYLEAMSGTYLLDQKRKTAAYQKKSMAYQELVSTVAEKTKNSSFLLADEIRGRTLNRFVVQYEETDWDFLKRVASFGGFPLVAAHTAKGAKFSVGVLWKNKDYPLTEEEESQMEIEQGYAFADILDKETEQNHQALQLRWHREGTQAEPLEIGDSVIYQQARYYVKAVQVSVANHQVRQECLLSSKGGFFMRERQNHALTGLSLAGSVKSVKGNQLKIHLDVDAQAEQECWFAYSTFYSTFYCMPEQGDRINLYFPDAQEEHAFVLNSVRSNAQTETGRPAGEGNGIERKSSVQEEGLEKNQGAAVASSREPVQTVIDIQPYLQQLAAPANGRLIQADIVWKEALAEEATAGGALSQTRKAEANQGMDTAMAQQSSLPGNGGSQRNYDFSSMAQNEKVKVLCTKGGQMVILDDDQGSVSLVCDNGTYISLDQAGITIYTQEELNLKATGRLQLNAGKELVVDAGEAMNISCGETKIRMTTDELLLYGKDIYLNKED